MKRLLLLALVGLVFLVACDDGPTLPDGPPLPELPVPRLDVVDGGQGASNPNFFWLPPFGASRRGFGGVADPGLSPVVEICVRNGAASGCDPEQPILARFARDEGNPSDRIQVDDQDHYFVQWRMTRFPPERDGVYRIRVLLQGVELGHADVVTLRQADIRAYTQQGDDEVVPLSDRGAVKIAFRIEENPLEAQFCEDGSTVECSVTVVSTDEETTLQLDASTTSGDKVAAVLTIPENTFVDSEGNPVDNVVVAAEVRIQPPSDDLLDDADELPWFVEVNTFPSGVAVDPGSDGVRVVVCQDPDALDGLGIPHPLLNELILYKVSDPTPSFPLGETRRLPTTHGAPECAGFASASANPAPGLLGRALRGASRVAALFRPTPLVATVLHGGLNTTLQGDLLLSPAFSTFGATLGPNAGATTAVVDDGTAGDSSTITVQVRTALGDTFRFGGDMLHVEVVGGPSTGAIAAVTDHGDGSYEAHYVPTGLGVDTIAITLTNADGDVLGAIAGSPYVSTVSGPPVQWSTGAGGNGHWYQVVTTKPQDPSWLDARGAAASRTWAGLPGHLVTIGSAAEQAFLLSALAPPFLTWIGVADEDFDGLYRWVTGEPVYDLGTQSCLAPYCNWAANEPNNNGAVEWYGEMWPGSGLWNDLPLTSPTRIRGYVVEHEPLSGSLQVEVTDGGAPVPGVTVTASGPESRAAVTDALGRAWLLALTPGTYAVDISALGYLPAASQTAGVSGFSSTTVSFELSPVPPATTGQVWHWSPGNGGNGHYYEYRTGSETWTAARAAAENLSWAGLPGHLVTIGSAAEQAFLQSVRVDSLGLNDWRPWIGLTDEAAEGQFAWVTGEPVSFTSWGPGEPNDAGGAEDYVELHADGSWNDIGNTPLAPYGYLIEYAPVSVQAPPPPQ